MFKLKQVVGLFAILPIPFLSFVTPIQDERLVAQRELSLLNRYDNAWVNEVFADNILLNLAYLRGTHSGRQVNWDEVKKPFEYSFRLSPNQTFAYHDDVLPKYEGKIALTTNAHFNAAEGFRSSGYLFGDGVCHLASLLYWVALDAGLEAEAPTNHNFMKINDVPKEYGVSIYSNPYAKGSNTMQNLYITNNKEKTVTFKFKYVDNKVKVSIIL